MDLLIYFAFPIATIIISVILQKLLKNPALVAAFVFAVFLIVTFTAFDETFLIATLAYTLLALLTAFIVSRLCEGNNGENDSNGHHGCRNVSALSSNRCRRF